MDGPGSVRRALPLTPCGHPPDLVGTGVHKRKLLALEAKTHLTEAEMVEVAALKARLCAAGEPTLCHCAWGAGAVLSSQGPHVCGKGIVDR